MKKALIIISCAAAALSLSACCFVSYHKEKDYSSTTYIDVTPSGTLATKEYSVTTFDEIYVNGSFHVNYVQGEPSVSVSASDNIMEYVTVTVDDSELVIDFTKERPKNTGRIDVTVSCPAVSDVVLSGSGEFTAGNGVVSSYDDFEAMVLGSGRISIIGLRAAEDAKITVTGSGKIMIKDASCKELEVQIAGSGKMDLQNMECHDAEITVAGSGKIEVTGHNSGSCEASIGGSGKIDLTGFKIDGRVSTSIAGSGKILK